MNAKKMSTVLCYAMNLLSAVFITMISPTLPQISGDLSLSLSQMGMLLMCQFVGFTVFVLLSGVVSDHIGKKKTLAGAMIILTVVSLLFSMIHEFTWLCIALFFLGGGMGVLEMMSNALLSDVTLGNSVFHLNFMQVFFGLGAIAGPILAGMAYQNGVSWRVVYQVLGWILACVTVLFMVNRLPSLPKSEKIDIKGVRNLIVDKKFLLICLCMFLYTGSESSGWGWMSTFTDENLGFSTMESSLAVAVFWISVTAGRLVIAAFIKKLDVRKLVMVLAVFAGIICALMSIVKEDILVWAVIVLLGLACSSQWGLILTYGTERYRRSTGTVFAMLVASGGIGMSIVPYLMGIMGDALGMRVSLFVPVVLFLLITLSFYFVPRFTIRKENKTDI